MATSKSTSNGIAFGLVAAGIWGAWPVFSQLGLGQTLTAYDITALRFGISGLVLAPIILRCGTGGLGWGRAIFLAVGAGVPYVLICVGGLAFAPAGHAGVITPSCMLICSTLGGWWVLGDRPTRQRIWAMAVMIAGVGLIGGQGFSGLGGEVWLGDMMFCVGGMLWASYTVAIRRWAVDSLHATALVSVLSMALYLPLYAIFNPGNLWTAPISEIAFQGVFQGLGAAILALLAYSRAVAILGAARGALFAALVPGIAVLLAVPLLGEHPSPEEWIGVVIVTAGIGWAMSPTSQVSTQRV